MDIGFFLEVFLRKPWLHISAYSYLIVAMVFFKKLSGADRKLSYIVGLYGVHTLISSYIAYLRIETSWTFNLICMPLTWMIIKLFTDNLFDKRHIRLIRNITVLCILIHVLNIGFVQGIRYIATYTYLILQIMNAIVAFYYLRDQMDNSDRHPSLNILNWFAAATLIDHITSIPITATLSQDMIGFTDRRYTSFLFNIMSFVYGCW
jgi:hypothetical protein